MSAPAAACDSAERARSSTVGIVDHFTVYEEAAVAV